jgi:predicted permease
MDTFLKDIRLGVRRLRRHPGFTAVALATLTLGIGANVAIFSVLDGVVLRPLPYDDPGRLVAVWPAQNFNKALAARFDEASTLESVSGLSHWSMSLTGDGDPEQVAVGMVDVDFFDMLGVTPQLGRTFLPEEVDPARSDVVVLTHGLWQRRYGGDPDIVGKVLPLDAYGQTAGRRVVGVLPRDWRAPVQAAEAWAPLDRRAGLTVANDSSWYVNWVFARLAPGATVEAASAEVRTLAERLREETPGLLEEEAVATAGVIPLRENLVGGVGGMIWLLTGAVALVLLIACVNVANLLLARGASREGEVAVRKALGASRGRLVRENLTESLLLALLGAAGGVVLAAWLLAVLRAELASRLPRAEAVALDWRVLAFSIVLAILAGVLFGLLPAVRTAQRDLLTGIRRGARGTTGQERHRLNRSLVAAETALALVLVSAAALAATSFWRLYTIDPGFRAEGVLAVEVAPAASRYATDEAERTYLAEVLLAVGAVPGVAGVEAIHLLPLTTMNWAFPYLAEGYEARSDRPLPAANFRVVSAGYFDLMGVKLISGRYFTRADGPGAEPVGIINRRLADEHWPGEDAVGRTIDLFGNQPFRVVGVVEDVHQHALDERPRAEMYRPHAQWPVASMVLMVRGERPGSVTALSDEVRSAVWSVDDDVPIPSLRPLSEVRDDSVARTRLLAFLLGGFGVLALVLGAVGVYGVMTYVTGLRTREFGVRLALGATPRSIQRSALGWGAVPVAAGIGAGLVATLAAGRLVAGLFFGIQPHDPVTLTGVVAVLSVVAAIATWIPARRATRIDVVDVLRQE